jgi:GT2 family glycosyltransferase
MDLAIVILNWNAVEDTINCVSKIVDWVHLKPAIFIVDNASKDNSAEIIRRAYPDIHLICNEENLGFAGGTNRGIMEATSQGDAPILLLNNDAFIQEDDVIRLLKTLLEHQTIGLVGPLLYDAEQEDRLISAGGKNPIKHHHTRILSLPPGEPVRLVEYVSGTAVIIKPEVFRAVGYLDEDYFFSTELADLCMRARQAGYLSAIDSRTRAYHTLSRSDHLRNTLYVYYIVRNRFIFIRNSPYRLKLLYYFFWTLYSLALFLRLALAGQKDTARAVFLGLKDGLQQRFGGQNERVLSACTSMNLTHA